MDSYDRLSICKTCEKHSFDFDKGMLCSLTNEKPAFETDKCPEYVCDSTAFLKEYDKEQERIADKKSFKTKTLVILWVLIGIGIIRVIFSSVYFVSELGFSWVTVIYILAMTAYCVLGIKTLIAFHKQKSNAISLAISYIAILVISYVFNIAISVVEHSVAEHISRFVIRMIIYVTAIAYLFNSEDIKDIIPKESRTWEKPEKWLVGVYAGCIFILIALFIIGSTMPD